MTRITDRYHLARRTQAGIAALLDLQDAWIEEDAAACAPRSTADGPTGTGTSDPTLTLADTPDRYRHRDHLGNGIARAILQLEQLIEAHKPRNTGGPCQCCKRDTATHGRDNQGRPTDCHRCWTYLRREGFRCNDEIHTGRSYVRMCECPTECCEVCPDRTEDGRALSRRCRGRKTRGLWDRNHEG